MYHGQQLLFNRKYSPTWLNTKEDSLYIGPEATVAELNLVASGAFTVRLSSV